MQTVVISTDYTWSREAADYESLSEVAETAAAAVAALGKVKECGSFYQHQEHHRKYSEWINHWNRTNIAPIFPFDQIPQLPVNFQMENGAELTTNAAGVCKIPFDRETITTDTPLRERALCPFKYAINYDPLVRS